MTFRSTAAIAALITATPATPTGAPRFTVSEVEYKLTADTRIGAKRSGLLCLPAGRLLWKEAAPPARALKGMIVAEARVAGLDVVIPSDDDFSDAVRTPYRIKATVERVAMNACIPWRGIRVGEQARLKVAGGIETVWRIFDQRRRALALKILMCRNVDQSEQSNNLPGLTARQIAFGAREVSRIIKESDLQLPGPENEPIVIGSGCPEKM